MTLDQELLSEAKSARQFIIDRDYEAERARLNFQHAVRRLHAAGGSLREIADALGISHQRVHQIVEGAEGKIAIKEGREGRSWGRRTRPACSFCGVPKEDARQLIAGPGAVYICATCVSGGSACISGEVGVGSVSQHLSTPADPSSPCSFCGKVFDRGGMVETGDVRICRDCLTLCDEILLKTGK